MTTDKDSSSTSASKWKPESLFDYLLAKAGHEALLRFLGIEHARYQPSEIHVEKQVPDRVFWESYQLHFLDLKIELNSRSIAQLDVKRSVARLHYVNHGPFPEQYATKYEAALDNVVVHAFCIFEPSSTFKNILQARYIKWYSVEEGKESATPLNYQYDPLPLIVADIRALLKKLRSEQQQEEEQLKKNLSLLITREFTPEEKLFLHRYKHLVNFQIIGNEMIDNMVNKLKEVTIMTDSELKQILKENLYLLSPEERLAGLKPEERLAGLKPEERLAGLKPEERLAGLKPEERLAGLKPEEIERLIKEAQRKLQEEIKKKQQQ